MRTATQRLCSAWEAPRSSHAVHDDPSGGEQEAQRKDRVHGLLPSTMPLDTDRPRSLVGMAPTLLVPISGMWQRGRLRTIIHFFAWPRCKLDAWKTVRGIHILHHAYQLSAVGHCTTAPETLVWNTPASGVSIHTEVIHVECDDGDQGLPSDPVRHRSAEQVPPPSPSASPL